MKEEISIPLLIVVAIILISQSFFLFIHARRKGHNYWFWGIIGLIQAPMPTLAYLIFVRKVFHKNNVEGTKE
ncbi:sigma-Y antisigma factor component [Cytobacillus sp. FJAT-53684]|uniref:Sigma-Y antisigma factor component n=1 Tax=Cytobacillus mangrovibacter TaxID=3299024 RepID=A0ABW6JWL9_9BACI